MRRATETSWGPRFCRFSPNTSATRTSVHCAATRSIRHCWGYEGNSGVGPQYGVVQHPSAWQHGGYNEIQYPPRSYGLMNREKLIAGCGLGSNTQLRKCHREWVEEATICDGSTRQPQWSESLAVGSEGFVLEVLDKLPLRAKGRKVREVGDGYAPRSLRATYSAHFGPENRLLSVENGFLWNE